MYSDTGALPRGLRSPCLGEEEGWREMREELDTRPGGVGAIPSHGLLCWEGCTAREGFAGS